MQTKIKAKTYSGSSARFSVRARTDSPTSQIKILDGIFVAKAPNLHSKQVVPLPIPRPRGWVNLLRRNKVSFAVALLMTFSFAAGMLTVLSGLETPAVASSSDSAIIEPRGEVGAQTSPAQTLDFVSQRMTDMLSQYREGEFPPEQSLERKSLLTHYLTEKHSPWASDDKTIEALLSTKNMRMILAISFVESNFGKHCADNNCSGIGVDPSSGSWRRYKSTANWVLDFDRLLNRRYKDWAPEEMRGVYVNPGSNAWVVGVYQVLDELTAAGIR